MSVKVSANNLFNPNSLRYTGKMAGNLAILPVPLGKSA